MVVLIQLERMGEECCDYEIFIGYVWDIYGIFTPEIWKNAMIMEYVWDTYGIFIPEIWR